MDEIRLSYESVENLVKKEIWISLFTEIQDALDIRLSRLDTNDPIRKKVADIKSAADFICNFGEQEKSRILFAKFDKSRILLMINLTQDIEFSNDISFYIPRKALENKKEVEKIIDLFKITNKHLKPFYSFVDLESNISKKKKRTGLSVDTEAELLGMFWLTHFNRKYVDFFGQEKVAVLPVIENCSNGVTFKFGELPTDPNCITSREEAQELLGVDSFVNPDLPYDKQLGAQALSYGQLRFNVYA